MFNPSLPADGTKATAAEMRAQLTGLKALIDAIPGITAAVVDSVTTVGPGQPATVTVSVIGTVLHLSLALPEGLPGPPGPPGLPGPPFANAVIDSITTLAPGQAGTVAVSFDGTNVHFSFALPQGVQGEQGIPGIPGAPGEVTTTAMTGAIASAIAGTSNNTNSVPTMDTPFTNDPPTLADMELMRAKRYLIGTHSIELQRTGSRATTMALSERFGLGYAAHVRYAEHIRAVGAADVLAVARKYLEPSRLVKVVVGP